MSNAYEGSANSIDARALLTAVAAEAVASLVIIPGAEKHNGHLSEFQKLLRSFIGKQKKFADLAPRIDGLIATLATERPQDKMYFLGRIGRIEPAYIKSFGNLRNRHVHPKIPDMGLAAIERIINLSKSNSSGEHRGHHLALHHLGQTLVRLYRVSEDDPVREAKVVDLIDEFLRRNTDGVRQALAQYERL